MRRKAKAVGHWLFENAYPALFSAGLTVGVSLLLFEEYFEEHSCKEVEGDYWKDLAKRLFWCMFLFRLVVWPLAIFLKKKIIPKEKFPSHLTLERMEVEIIDGIETGVFVFETMQEFEASYVLGFFISAPALWPIFCTFYKFRHPDFVRGPKGYYKHFPFKKKWTFIVIECLYNTLSLSSAMSFLVSLLFNILYDSTHPKSYSHERAVLIACIAGAGILGASSVRGKRLYKAMTYSEAFVNSLYYSLNIAISSIACIKPSYFTDEGFKHTGWIYTLVFGLVCLGIAFVGGFHGMENCYIDHHDTHDSHAGNPYTIYPFLEGEKYSSPPVVGLTNPLNMSDGAICPSTSLLI
ncbi:MAG: hypothetical protein KDH94_01330 [Coxiellaceae bacterium]|nr:hypothetical protein [Coxiellaceae bacterium]